MIPTKQSYSALRDRYPEFIYHGYEVRKEAHSLWVQYDYELPGFCHFRPWMEFPERAFIHTDRLNEAQLDNLLFNIGMIELVSYWKATCSPQVSIKPYRLTKEQADWWKHVYFSGLGEFFYLNGIAADPQGFMEITSDSLTDFTSSAMPVGNEVLVPIGGGKDSVVTLELLKGQGFAVRPLIMNPRGATVNTAAVAGFEQKDCLVIKRNLDPQLLRLNEQGFLNGHTPFSAMLGFYSLLAAALTGSKFIALSNEASANEATIKGTLINHQYSKSYEFEKDFREYTHSYISKDLEYFSFLRPVHEIQIAKLFSRFPKYFPVFRSCNAGSKADVWCGVCAKCLFAYIILSPCIAKETLIQIFGRDLLDDLTLLDFFNELTGISENKPFECIGTVEEVNLALQLTIQQRKEMPALLKYYMNHPGYQPFHNISPAYLSEGTTPHHFLNEEFMAVLKKALND